MRTPSKRVYDLLAAARATLGLGTPLSTENWALYRDVMPQDPGLVVAVYATPSPAIDVPLDPTHAYVETCYVQIIIRGRSREEAEAKLVTIRDYLTTRSHSETETTLTAIVKWQAIRHSGSAFVSGDTKALYPATLNLQVIRSVEGVQT